MPEDAPETEEKTEEETGEETEEKLNPTVTVEDLGPCKQRLNIEVAADTVSVEVDKAYKELLDSVDVPGFRKGHVPRSIAERKFGKQINEELGQNLTSRAFVEALEAKEMDAIGKPEFGEVKLERGKPLAFEATVYLKPQVEIEDCKGIPLRKKSAEVTNKDVDERIEMLCKARAPLAPVDRGAEADDLVTFDFKITADGKELRSIEEARLAIDGESLFGIKVDSLEKVFAGRKTGDEFEFDVTLPDNFREEEYREKPARIRVKMKEVKTPRLPEVNDEWAKSLDFDDLEDMRDEFEAAIKREKTASAEADLREQVREYLLEHTDFELPEDLIEQQEESIFVRMRMEMESRGMSPEEIDKQIEEVRSTQHEVTYKSFKLLFILQHLAEKEKIFVTEDEVDARIAAIAASRGLSPSEVRTLYEQKDVMNELRAEMREEKTIRFIIDNADIGEAEE